MSDVLVAIDFALLLLLTLVTSSGMAWADRYKRSEQERIALHIKLQSVLENRITELEDELSMKEAHP